MEWGKEMTITYVVINIVIMLIMLFVLNKMADSVVYSPHFWLGSGFYSAHSTDYLQQIQRLSTSGVGSALSATHIAFLKMIVMPLVMVSIIQAITNLESSGLRKMAGMVVESWSLQRNRGHVGSVTADVFGIMQWYSIRLSRKAARKYKRS